MDNNFEITDKESIEKMKRMQRMEAIENTEDYEIDSILNEHKPESKVNISEEKINSKNNNYSNQNDETFFDDIDKKYMIEDDLSDENDNVQEEEIYFDEKDSKYTNLEDGQIRDDTSKEYLNRKDTIFKDPVDFNFKNEPKMLESKKPKEEKQIDFSNITTYFAILLSLALIIFTFSYSLKISLNKEQLTSEEQALAIELTTFISFNQEYIKGINQLANEKRILLESYLKNIRTNKELALELTAILKKENEILNNFTTHSWENEITLGCKNMSLEYIQSNINTSKQLIKMLGDYEDKGYILEYYNKAVNTHEIYINTINNNIKSELNELNIETVIEDNFIQIKLN